MPCPENDAEARNPSLLSRSPTARRRALLGSRSLRFLPVKRIPLRLGPVLEGRPVRREAGKTRTGACAIQRAAWRLASFLHERQERTCEIRSIEDRLRGEQAAFQEGSPSGVLRLMPRLRRRLPRPVRSTTKRKSWRQALLAMLTELEPIPGRPGHRGRDPDLADRRAGALPG